MNSITIYLAQSIIGFGGIAKFFFGGVAGLCSEPWAEVVTDASYVFVCWLFLYFLYRQKIFLKV
jgi:predicted acyltransferase